MAKEKEASREEIAEILGVDVRTITNYVKLHSDFPNRVHGKHRYFPIARCVTWKIDHDVADAIAAMAPPAPSTILDAEKRKAIADAELAELKVQKLRSEVVPVAEALKEINKAYTRVRARFISVPGEFAPRFLNLTTMPEAVAQLRELSSTVLSELQQAAVLEEEEEDPAASGGEQADTE